MSKLEQVKRDTLGQCSLIPSSRMALTINVHSLFAARFPHEHSINTRGIYCEVEIKNDSVTNSESSVADVA